MKKLSIASILVIVVLAMTISISAGSLYKDGPLPIGVATVWCTLSAPSETSTITATAECDYGIVDMSISLDGTYVVNGQGNTFTSSNSTFGWGRIATSVDLPAANYKWSAAYAHYEANGGTDFHEETWLSGPFN